MKQEEPPHTGRQTARMKREHFIEHFSEKLSRFFGKYFLVLLVLLTIIVLLALFVSLVGVFDEDNSNYLSSLVLSSAALIAMLTFWREHNKTALENRRSTSKFFLRRASDGLNALYELLKDQNNDRVIWIHAARTLLESVNLAKEIELEEYRHAYRLHEGQVKYKLYLMLRAYDESTYSFQPLPPQFFFGTPRWKVGEPLDDLAKEHSQKFEVHDITLDKVPIEPPLGPLSEESVWAIFDFLDYPRDN